MKNTSQRQCPIFDLDDWILQSNDVDTLCAGFSCAICVAIPEDFGYNPSVSKEATGDSIDGEIPF